MITYHQGNLFNSGADALVNCVNVKGVMGAGLALQFKNKFPVNFNAYQDACAKRQLHIGTVLGVQEKNDGVWIINFPTKEHWRNPSTLTYIQEGLAALVKFLERHPEISSIAVPALGCGYGGLDWKDVRPLIEAHLGELEIRVMVYVPN